MNLSDLRERIESLVSFIGFDYNDKACGIDPINAKHFDMWCGDECVTAESIEEVFNVRIFEGKSLPEIFDNITNLDI